MGISVEGLTFYHPTVNITTEFKRDSDGNNVGHRDIVTIQDIVFSSDVQDLVSVYNTAITSAVGGAPVGISYPGNDNTAGTIKSVSLDDDSDLTYRMTYSITIEAIPTRSLYSIYSSLSGVSGLINSLTESESWDRPYDLTSFEIPISGGSGLYYNKPITYEYNLSCSCGHNPSGIDESLLVSNKILTSLGRSSPSSGLVPDLSEYTGGVSSIRKSCGEDGTVSLNVKSLYLPKDTSGLYTVSMNTTELRNEIQSYKDRSVKITVTSLPIGLEYDSSGNYPWSVTGFPSGLYVNAYNIITGIKQELIDTSGMIEVEKGLPGKKQNCTLTRTKLDETGCWSTKNLTITKDYGSNSATLDISQTTQNIGLCDISASGYKINYSIVRHEPRNKNKIYAEPKVWSSTGYWVQDMSTYRDIYYEYSIDLESSRKCTPSGTGIVDMAKLIFSGIDIMRGDGIITSKTINVNNDKCSYKIIQYSGTSLASTGIGYP
jgi:hypothetical protein